MILLSRMLTWRFGLDHGTADANADDIDTHDGANPAGELHKWVRPDETAFSVDRGALAGGQ
ncbi:hypothetical protein SAMN05216330_11449 [Bradyrhizobium sp. Ghvi]|nr:hypothetical protein SAMN05216330_11449 [Bradyrhizobium sp. Ghvi]